MIFLYISFLCNVYQFHEFFAQFSDGRRKGRSCYQKYTSYIKSHSKKPSHLFKPREKVSPNIWKIKINNFLPFFLFFFQTIKGLRIPSVNNSIEQCGIISYCQPNSVWALRSREYIRSTVEVLLRNFFWFIIIINNYYCLSWFIADLQLNTPKDTIQFLR